MRTLYTVFLASSALAVTLATYSSNLLNSSAWGGSGFEIMSVSPEGTVKDVRQVRVSFSTDMVKFGDPRSTVDPLQVKCTGLGEIGGKSRWADTKNWIYDFDKDLIAGVRCQLVVRPDLKSVSGESLKGNSLYEFSTGGPNVRSTQPWEGSQIVEDQIFVLRLDSGVDAKSVLQNAYFSVSGIQEKISLKVIDEDPRDQFSKKEVNKLKIFAHKFAFVNRMGKTKGLRFELLVQPTRPFPPDSDVTLVWGKGVASQGGVPTENSQTLNYKVRKEFTAEFNCERENVNSPCIPISSLNLNLSSQVSWKQLREIKLKAKSGATFSPVEPEDSKKDPDFATSWVQFKAPLPEKTEFQIILPANLKDDADRILSNQNRFPLTVATGDFPPLIKFPGQFGVIELKPEAVLPVTVRNVEAKLKMTFDRFQGKSLRLTGNDFAKVVEWIRRVESQERDESVFDGQPAKALSHLEIPKPNGERAFEVMGIPIKKPGLYITEFESKKLGTALLGTERSMFVSNSALVTNLAVHVKRANDSSVVWVTSLDTGKPVEGADVSLKDCNGTSLGNAKTGSNGIALIERDKSNSGPASCREKKGERSHYSQYNGGLFAIAEKDGDFSFAHSSWTRGIESYRFNLPGGYELKRVYSHTVFDRTLFRAGEVVHMKHFIRQHTKKGVEAIAQDDDKPTDVEIHHYDSDEKFSVPIRWRENGVAESTWTIPKEAKLGTYSMRLKAGNETYSAGEVRVEQYRVPLMKGRIKPLNTGDLMAEKEVPVELSVEYLSGGVASNLPVQLRYQTSVSSGIEFPDYEGLTFGQGKVPDPANGESSENLLAEESGPFNEEIDLDEPTPHSESGPSVAGKAKRINLVLGKQGSVQAIVPLEKLKADRVRKLSVEMDYKDPNGEIQTTGRSLKVYPASRLVAVKPEGWYGTKKSLKFQVVVADLKGKAVQSAPVEVEIIERVSYSHRKRLVGGLYAYDTKNELKRRGSACKGKTDDKGLLTCDIEPPVAGNILLEAKTVDEGGRSSFSYGSAWIVDSDEWWFAQDNSERIDVLPEKKHYEVGETAKFQVRMPFREATALVSVEREGVLDAWVVPVSGTKPVVEVPIKENYAPNAFISVMVVRGRVGEPQPTALVDLGKPAYKLGISEIFVGWKPHELKVKVESAKPVFQVRETGKFKIKVVSADGKPLAKNSEVAIAVVDEGLLQLKNNESWDLLEAMMARRGYEVETFTAQSEVIGKRHFGLKAQPIGGDGGKAPARQIFDSLLYWNAKVKLDANGEAEVQVKMNDSVTGFKVAAVAHSGDSRFGTGYLSFQTTQDLVVLSGIPPLAREGDQLDLQLTVKNSTKSLMKVSLIASASVVGGKTGISKFEPPVFEIQPMESKQLKWPVVIPFDVGHAVAGVGGELRYEISAKDAENAKNTDRLVIKQKVIEAVPVRVLQATLSQLDPSLKEPFQMPIEKPKDAISGRGGVKLLLDSSLLSNLEGVKDYMGWYPYNCVEQQISRAISTRNVAQFQKVIAELPAYLDSDGLVKYFQSSWLHGSDILSAYLVAVTHESGWEIPRMTRERILDGLENFVNGKVVRVSDLATADLTIRKIAALEALSRYGRAQWKMVGSLDIKPNLWSTSALIDWSSFLLKVGSGGDEALKYREEANRILASRLNFQGTVMSFSTENTDQLWWMMVSPSVNANRFLILAMSDSDNKLWKTDLGRIARGALSRHKRGHWDTTTANTWGVIAFEKFKEAFEKDQVTGKTSASLVGSGEKSVDWKPVPLISPNRVKESNQKVIDFAWPESGSSSGVLKVSHAGSGKPWITLQSLAAVPFKEPFTSGYQLKKTMSAVEQKTAGKWSVGDVARVRLEMQAQTDMSWVVVNDPVPAGTTILGSGLGGDSAIATHGEKQEGWVEPAFQERAFDGYRAYYQWVPKGNWVTEYTIRFNQSGKMN